MPTIVRAHGLRFAIFTDDHPPPHVHVSGRGVAKIGLGIDVPIIDNQGMSKPDIVRTRNVVKAHRATLLQAWNAIHG